MTIRQAIDVFLSNRSTFCAVASVDYYKGVLSFFLAFCDQEGIKDYSCVDELLLQRYLLYLRCRKCKSTTCHNYFRGIYTMIHYLEEEFNMQHVKKIKLPKLDPELIMPLSQSEVEKLYHSVNNLDARLRIRDLLILHLMLDCGLRSSEVLNLKKSDITSGTILVQVSKNNKSRVLPLPEAIRQLIIVLPEHNSCYLIVDEFGEQMSKDALKHFFSRLKTESGVLRVHAHLLRHTFATSYIYHYGNLEFLRIYMGHSSYDVTRQYINLSNQCLLTDFNVYKIPDCYK